MKNYSDFVTDLILDPKVASFEVVKRTAKFVYVKINFESTNAKFSSTHRAYNDTNLPNTK